MRYWDVKKTNMIKGRSGGIRIKRITTRILGENDPTLVEQRSILAVNLPHSSATVSESLKIVLSDKFLSLDRIDGSSNNLFYQKHGFKLSCAEQPDGITYFLASIIIVFQQAETSWTSVLDMIDALAFLAVRWSHLATESRLIDFCWIYFSCSSLCRG